MQIKIMDEKTKAEISTFGAELQSLIIEGRELLWQGNSAIWDGRATVLFPFIGRCCCDSYLYQGQRYNMGLHGFAWKQEFQLVEKNENSCQLELTDNSETRANYPFAFTFRVGFKLHKGSLRVSFMVHNRSQKVMPFALGWHPGFALETAPEGYCVHFFESQTAEEICIVTKCMITGKTKTAEWREKMPLSREMFLSSARVFRGLGSSARLEDNQGRVMANMEYPGFPVTTLWQTLGSGAGFVCIEPWIGRPGRYDTTEELGKDGKVCLSPSEVFYREIVINSSDR